MATDKTTRQLIDDEVAEIALRIQARDVNALLFVFAVEHAWPEGDGRWVIQFDKPTENEQLQKQFMTQLLRCALTPEEDHKRNGLIRDAIADETNLGDLKS